MQNTLTSGRFSFHAYDIPIEKRSSVVAGGQKIRLLPVWRPKKNIYQSLRSVSLPLDQLFFVIGGQQ